MIPVIMAFSSPVSAAMPVAIGTRATIVPTLVPIDMDTKHAARNSPARISFPGRIVSVRFTVASTAPIELAVWAKAPASTNIHIISRTFLLPAPREKIAILSSMLNLSSPFPRVIARA